MTGSEGSGNGFMADEAVVVNVAVLVVAVSAESVFAFHNDLTLPRVGLGVGVVDGNGNLRAVDVSCKAVKAGGKLVDFRKLLQSLAVCVFNENLYVKGVVESGKQNRHALDCRAHGALVVSSTGSRAGRSLDGPVAFCNTSDLSDCLVFAGNDCAADGAIGVSLSTFLLAGSGNFCMYNRNVLGGAFNRNFLLQAAVLTGEGSLTCGGTAAGVGGSLVQNRFAPVVVVIVSNAADAATATNNVVACNAVPGVSERILNGAVSFDATVVANFLVVTGFGTGCILVKIHPVVVAERFNEIISEVGIAFITLINSVTLLTAACLVRGDRSAVRAVALLMDAGLAGTACTLIGCKCGDHKGHTHQQNQKESRDSSHSLFHLIDYLQFFVEQNN